MTAETNTQESNTKAANNSPITVQDFVQMLWEKFCDVKDSAASNHKDFTMDHLLNYGHLRGWLEDWDEHDSERLVDKKAAARIIHQFMKIELNIPEIEDRETYSKAEELRDLYLCRSCANHIAHVYVRGIMEAEFVEVNGEQALIFNGSRTITHGEAENFINRIFLVKS